jgi:cholesterol oxidase
MGQHREFSGGIRRQTSAFDGDSFLGSAGGAKASADFVYLGPVLGKGVTVRDLCEVSRISRQRCDDGDAYAVSFTDLTTGKPESVLARKVVLAAGTMNTLRLLFASSSGDGRLAAMPALGRTFGANGDLLGAWFRNDRARNSFRGLPSLGAFTVDGHDAAMLAMASLAGLETLPLPAWLKRRLKRLYVIFGIGVDSGKASVAFRDGRLRVHYDQSEEPVFADIRAAFKVLEMQSGDSTFALKKPLTPHQWGGACIGADASRGVIDHLGEVYGNPGLFITDGSSLPAAPGGPPALTIAAWAHHVADGLAKSIQVNADTRK